MGRGVDGEEYSMELTGGSGNLSFFISCFRGFGGGYHEGVTGSFANETSGHFGRSVLE